MRYRLGAKNATCLSAGLVLGSALAAFISTPGSAHGMTAVSSDEPGEYQAADQSPKVPASAQKTNVVYATVGGKDLVLDVYLRKKDRSGNPGFILFAGGDGSNKERMETQAGVLAAEGYTVVTPNYCIVADQVPFPGYIHNIKAAVRFVRAHAKDYDINPQNIFAGGTSYGGVMTSLVGTTGDRPDLEGTVGKNAGVSSKISGAVDLFGSVYFGRVEGSTVAEVTLKRAFLSVFRCFTLEDCPAADHLMPEQYISAGDPPFLIIHGTDDKNSSPLQSQKFQKALRAAGIPATLLLVPGFGHNPVLIKEKISDIRSFLESLTK